MTDAAPTRRDPPRQSAATRRDVADPRATRRDQPEAPDPAVETGGLPAPLFEEYEPVSGMPAGGEAHLVMRVRHRADGSDHVVKLYGSAIRPDPELLMALQRADSDHLVRITGWGEHTDRFGNSTSWEVLEHVAGGSLRDLVRTEGPRLPEARVREILVELTNALEHLHTGVRHGSSTGLAHRDVKPENILVRTREPLDLVFCDFGLVAEIRTTRMTTRQAGTAEYQAPETWLRRSRDAEQDWWALGVVITELLIGRNPNSGIMDEAIDDAHTLFEHLTQHGVDLSEVTDPRWRMLCAGLLTFAQDYRWGAAEIRSWLAGGSPAVHSGRFEERAAAEPATSPIEVAGRACREPAEVALAISENWSAATRLFESRDQRLDLDGWLRDNFADVVLPKDLFARDPASRTEAALRAARFISWVAPELRPSFQGRAADADGIAALAASAVHDPTAATLLAQLDAAALRVFGRHRCTAHPRCGDRCEVLESAADRWDSARRALDLRAQALAPRLRPAPLSPLTGEELADAQATLVRTLVDPAFVDGLRRELVRDQQATGASWWRQLSTDARQGTSPDQLAALVLAAATTGRARAAMAATRAAEAVKAKAAADAARDARRESIRRATARLRPISRDLLALLMALVVAYLATFVAVQGFVLIDQGTTTDPTELQVRLAFPVAVLLACALIRPRAPASAGRRAVQIALGSAVVLAGALPTGQLHVLVFPIEWRTGVADGLVALNTLFTGNAESMPVTLGIAALAALALSGWTVAVARRGVRSDLPGVRATKRALVFAVVALFALRAAHLWFHWEVPTWLPSPMSVWLTI
ncbi:hypothetical protein ALI22I_28695 [Saccharothrix sp. ALI-22-I]|uniref:protein kinase domain-containing protein n=1 Tax=Saccharothrix sp. ALI-22-I TaxID=1933778 RepID=UPI00097C0C9E|nr:protein kinase [Saccharothrix sp. ALI-22-I]ONI84535.1 hypothetical protein ALI22I_28695 [Saccharothrix sp. ALI-22-I]